MSFSSFDLHADLLKGLAERGFTAPTALQEQTLPSALGGRDVLARAGHGSGKTAAFLLPLLNRLLDGADAAGRALVITATAEAAARIAGEVEALAAGTPLSWRLLPGAGADGNGLPPEAALLIATPGDLSALAPENGFPLDEVGVVVVDEADRMEEMGELPAVASFLPRLGARRQTLLFAESLPAAVQELAAEILDDPVGIGVEAGASPAEGELARESEVATESAAAGVAEAAEEHVPAAEEENAEDSAEETPVAEDVAAGESEAIGESAPAAASALAGEVDAAEAAAEETPVAEGSAAGEDQPAAESEAHGETADESAAAAEGEAAEAVYPVDEGHKAGLLAAMLADGSLEQALVFTRTKLRTNRLADRLRANGTSCERIHGNRSPRQRGEALAGFRQGVHRVLVATDPNVAGVDPGSVSHVVNFDVPLSPEDYLQRAGCAATAFTFVASEEEAKMRSIERSLGRQLEVRRFAGFDYDSPPGEELEAAAPAEAKADRPRGRSRGRERRKGEKRGGDGARPASEHGDSEEAEEARIREKAERMQAAAVAARLGRPQPWTAGWQEVQAQQAAQAKRRSKRKSRYR